MSEPGVDLFLLVISVVRSQTSMKSILSVTVRIGLTIVIQGSEPQMAQLAGPRLEQRLLKAGSLLL